MKLTADKLIKPGLGPGSPGSPGANTFWTPQGIKEVINGIKELLQQYNQMRTGQVPPGTNNPGANVAQTGISKAEMVNFMRQFLDNLIAQGNGDKTILAVLKDFPATIKQLRGMLG